MPCPLVFGMAVSAIGFLAVRAGSPRMNLWHSNEDVFMVLAARSPMFTSIHYFPS